MFLFGVIELLRISQQLTTTPSVKPFARVLGSPNDDFSDHFLSPVTTVMMMVITQKSVKMVASSDHSNSLSRPTTTGGNTHSSTYLSSGRIINTNKLGGKI